MDELVYCGHRSPQAGCGGCAPAPYPEDYCPCSDYPYCKMRGEWFCFIHHEHEIPLTEPHWVCFECGHVYQTEQDLVDDEFTANGGDIEKLPNADDITFCPWCLHDW